MFRFLILTACVLMQSLAFAQDKDEKIKALYEPRTLVPIIAFYGNVDQQNSWQKNGVVFDDFCTVKAFSNKRDGKYQCTELVHRFLNAVYGIPTQIGEGLGHANVLLQKEKKRFGEETYKYLDKIPVKMKLRQNGLSKEPPAPASAINFRIGSNGHTAIVRFVHRLDDQNVLVYLFEQHGFPKMKVGDKSPIHAIKFTKSSHGTWRGEKVEGIGTPYYWMNFEIQ